MNLANEILEAGGSEALAQASRSSRRDALGPNFPMAVRLAAECHAGRCWAGTQLPTLDHAMDLSARLIHQDAGEDLAILALFHEGVEITSEELGRCFGSRVQELRPFCRPIAQLPHPLEESWAISGLPSFSTYPREAILFHAHDAILLAQCVRDDYQALLQDPSHSIDPLRAQLQGTFQTLCLVMAGENILQLAEETTIWSR